MKYIIRAEDLVKDHLLYGCAFFNPGLGSSVVRLKNGTYHMPYMSSPHSLDEAFTWMKSQYEFWITLNNEEENQRFTSNPLWSKAIPFPNEWPKAKDLLEKICWITGCCYFCQGLINHARTCPVLIAT